MLLQMGQFNLNNIDCSLLIYHKYFLNNEWPLLYLFIKAMQDTGNIDKDQCLTWWIQVGLQSISGLFLILFSMKILHIISIDGWA